MSEQSTPAADTAGGERTKLNVGGKLFETTVSTLRSGGPDSLLSVLSNRPGHDPVFIDRDPEIFSVLLSLLRSNRLPSTAKRFSNQELIDEALYFGIESQLRSALAPSRLNGIDASLHTTVKPSSDGVVTDFDAVDSDGSIWVAHGGQISVYDWNLGHAATVRTHLDFITSVKNIQPEIAAVGSLHGSGLHFYSMAHGSRVDSVEWVDPSDVRIYKARVHAVADSADSVFASYECQHGENCILMIDKPTMRISSEIGRMSGNSSKNLVPTKLKYLPNMGILFGSSVTSGAFGYSGYIRLWDPRTRDVVWETNEPGSGRSSRFGDSFADSDVDLNELSLFKICSKSGDLAMADLRKLSDDPWIYLKEKNPSMRNVGCNGGGNFVVHCYHNQVFVGRKGELEVWSRVKGNENEEIVSEGVYRRNHVDKIEDSSRGSIKKIEGGGNRLFVTREDVEGIEVWQSTCNSGVVSVLDRDNYKAQMVTVARVVDHCELFAHLAYVETNVVVEFLETNGVAFQERYGDGDVEIHDHDKYTQFRSQNRLFPTLSIVTNSTTKIRRGPDFTESLLDGLMLEPKLVKFRVRKDFMMQRQALGLLTMSTPPVLANTTGTCREYRPECIGHVQKVLLYTSMPLIAFGMAGHLTCLTSFINGQFSGEELDGSTFWRFFYIVLAIVTVTFVTVVPPIWDPGYMHSATIIPTIPLEEQANNIWRLCTVTEVEETKIIIRRIPVWTTFILCGVLISVRFTFFIEQLDHLDHKLGRLTVPTPLLLFFFEQSQNLSVNKYYWTLAWLIGVDLVLFVVVSVFYRYKEAELRDLSGTEFEGIDEGFDENTTLLWADILVLYAFFVMQNYLTNVWKLSFTHAAGILNVWGGISLMLPVFFLFLVDAVLGHFTMLVFSSLAYTVGIVLVTMSTPPVLANSTGSCKKYEPQCVGRAQKALFYTGMALIAVGIAGHLVSIRPFLDEQKDRPIGRNHSSIIECLKLPGFTLIVVLPIVGAIALPYIKPWDLRFGIPAICTALTTVFFLTGWCTYDKVSPQGSPLTNVCRVFVAVFLKKFERVPVDSDHLYIRDDENLQSFSRTLENRWRLCSVSEVEDAKIAVRMIPMWLTFIMCGIVSSTGNTYFVEQANHMDRKLGSWKVPIPILLLLSEWVKSLFASLASCYLKRSKSYAPSIGIAISMVFSILCCVTAARIENRRIRVIWEHNLADKPDDEVPMSVFWMLFQFFLLAGLNAFLEKGVGKFYEDQSPESMRRYLELFTKGVSGLGFVFGVVSVYAVGKVSERRGGKNWFQYTLNRSRLDRYYWVLAGLSSANLVVFAFVASFYRYKDREMGDERAEVEGSSSLPSDGNGEAEKRKLSTEQLMELWHFLYS
ncbi:major facilitator superfamily protein [Striga asiatica]|uniref:Major facilitator superfamily protein n=1 Tax=Striga asiatica TaxID=4170 RepID=A0A5A7RF55_STRAF|nr:major facilitator superfamily protein [Striga asiatica]